MPDVLAGEDDEAAGDEAGVLPGLEHAGQPVEAGVGVGAPDRLDEGGDDVVVLVAPVAQGLRAEAASASSRVTCPAVLGRARGDRHLEAGEHGPGVAVGAVGQRWAMAVVVGRWPSAARPRSMSARSMSRRRRAARGGTGSSG